MILKIDKSLSISISNWRISERTRSIQWRDGYSPSVKAYGKMTECPLAYDRIWECLRNEGKAWRLLATGSFVTYLQMKVSANLLAEFFSNVPLTYDIGTITAFLELGLLLSYPTRVSIHDDIMKQFLICSPRQWGLALQRDWKIASVV